MSVLAGAFLWIYSCIFQAPALPSHSSDGASGETEAEDWRRRLESLRAHLSQRGEAPPLQPRRDLEGPGPPLAARDVQATLAESEGRGAVPGLRLGARKQAPDIARPAQVGLIAHLCLKLSIPQVPPTQVALLRGPVGAGPSEIRRGGWAGA